MKKYPVIFIYLFFLCGPVFAQDSNKEFSLSKEDEDMVFMISDELADCSGALYAVSELFAARDDKNSAQSFKELANGYYMVAAYQLFDMQIIPVWKSAISYAEGRADMRKVRYLSPFESALESETVKSLEDLGQITEACIEKLGEYQAEQATEMRRLLYKNKDVQ